MSRIVRNTDPARAYYRGRAVRTSYRRPDPRLKRAVGVLHRHRAVTALATVGLTAGVLTSSGTFALWSDTATAQAGTFSAGSFDIGLDNTLTSAGGSITRADLTLSAMLPGESKAVTIVAKNNGTTPLTYTVLGTGTGGLGTSLQVAIVPAATATNSTSTSGFRTGACGSATPTFTNLAITSVTVSSASRALTAGSSENSCVIVRLDPNTGTGLQGANGSGSLAYAAVQPTS